jgi:ABC-type sugar transport system permease subunit
LEFNEEQREGIAKVSDNLATASMVTAIVGGLVDHKIGYGVALALVAMFIVLLFAGVQLRKKGDDGNGN